VNSVCYGYQGLAVAISSNSTNDSCQLTFWRLNRLHETTHLDHLKVPVVDVCAYSLWMDENYVVVCQRSENYTWVLIVSLKTRTIVENLSDSSLKHIRYERGLLIMKYPSFIR
jgi:hypothetical protein